METSPKPGPKHVAWAIKAVRHYACYRVLAREDKGKPSGRSFIDLCEVIEGLDHERKAVIPTGVIPTDEDLLGFKGWKVNYEMKDFLQVRASIGLHCQDHPEDASLPEFMSWSIYHLNDPGLFPVRVAFQPKPVPLAQISRFAVANAWYAVRSVIMIVASGKAVVDQSLQSKAG